MMYWKKFQAPNNKLQTLSRKRKFDHWKLEFEIYLVPPSGMDFDFWNF